MNLIEQYVEAVTGYLPKDIREKVWWEVRIQIEEMLPENATEEEIRDVLEQLGNPHELAKIYQPQKRYLIGPNLYPQYFSVLKIVLSIVSITLVSITTITWGFQSLTETTFMENLIQFWVELIAITFDGVLQATVWVTVIFAILERKNIEVDEISFPKIPWSINDLQGNQKDSQITRIEIIIQAILTIVLVGILYFFPQVFAIYLEDGTRIPFFESQQLNTYLSTILVFGTVNIGFLIWQWISRYWNFGMAIFNAVYNIGFCVLLLTMLQDQLLFNSQWLTYFNDINLNIVSARGLGILIIVANLLDSINGFRKCRSKSNYPKHIL